MTINRGDTEEKEFKAFIAETARHLIIEFGSKKDEKFWHLKVEEIVRWSSWIAVPWRLKFVIDYFVKAGRHGETIDLLTKEIVEKCIIMKNVCYRVRWLQNGLHITAADLNPALDTQTLVFDKLEQAEEAISTLTNWYASIGLTVPPLVIDTYERGFVGDDLYK